MKKEDIISKLKGRILTQKGYEKEGLYGQMPHGSITALEGAIELIEKLETPSSSTLKIERISEVLENTPELNMSNYDHEDVLEQDRALLSITDIIGLAIPKQ